MFRKVYGVISLVVCLSMIMSIIPVPAAGMAENASSDNISQRNSTADNTVPLPAPLSGDPLAEMSRRVASMWASHPEPTPVPVRTPLPPGAAATRGYLHPYSLYLPFVANGSTSITETNGAVEREDLRTRYSKTFQRPDGSGYALVYMHPIHYKTPNGAWREIDNTWVADPDRPGVYRNAANDFEVQVFTDTKRLYLQDGATSLDFYPQGLGQSHGHIASRSIAYHDAASSITLDYTIRSDGVNLNYALEKPPSNEELLDIIVHARNGDLTLSDNILTLMEQDRIAWSFSLLASTTGGEIENDAQWTLSNLGSGDYLLHLIPDQEWFDNLGDDSAVLLSIHGAKRYDPLSTNDTGNRSVNKDAYVESGYPDTEAGNQGNLYLGKDNLYNKGYCHIYARFNSPNLPPGTSITNARAYFYQYSAQASSSYQTQVCRVTQYWKEFAITWHHRPNQTSCQGYVSTGKSTGWKYWTITGFAQAWQSGTPNHGILIRPRYDNHPGGIYTSHDCSSSWCHPGHSPYMRIEYTLSPVLRISDGLDFSQNPIIEGSSVTANFQVKNIGGAAFNGNLRAYNKSGTPTFAEQSVSIAGNDGIYHYQASQTFPTPGDYQICAQYNDGSWHDLTPDGGVTCRTLTVVDRTTTDIQLSGGLVLSPTELEPGGGTVRATFTAHNTTAFTLSENFRARVINGTNFPESGNQTLPPDYAYNQTASFTQPGIYEVVAEHYVNGAWHALVGTGGQNGSGYIRVKASPPPPPKVEKGDPPTSGRLGEPVNTSTGNYFYDVTDLSDPTPGLYLEATRWYNSLDAPDVNGPFGYGTSWTYNMTVTLRSDKSAIVRMGDGHLAYFLGAVDPSDPTNLDGAYVGQNGDFGTLVRSGDVATLTTPDQTVYYFDANGYLTRITHPYPAEISIVYSGTLPVELIHSAGVTYTLTYSGPHITRITSSSGRAVTYTYSISGDLASVIRPDGSTYTYFYDENHRLTESRDPNGHAFVRNVYDSEGRIIRQYDQAGQESVFSYGTSITQTRIFTDALGNVVTHIYDSEYHLIKEVDSLGYTTIYTRDAQGNVIARQDKDGSVWHYTYDAQGNLLSETDPLSYTWTYTYDAHNNRTAQTDPLARTWAYEYDSNDRLARTTDPLGHTHEYAYDAQGNLIWEKDETGAETRYGYNELGLQTVITDALGNVTRMAYDAFGNQTVYTDANGYVAYFVYDELNRLVKSIDPMGTVITFTYDAMGNLLTESDGMGHLKHYTYDEYDRLIAEMDFNGNVTRYSYDALGRQTVITDALGYTTVYTYDAVGNLIAQQEPDGTVTRYEDDPMGRLVRETDALSRTTEYVYDAAGRQIEVRQPCDACAGGWAVSHTTYDAAGQVVQETDPRGAITQYTYDALGRQAVMTDTYGHATTTAYDAAGRVIQEVNPLGAITRYEYDRLGRLITTTNALGYQTVNRYDAVGNIIQVVNERGYTTTYTYDANDRVLSVIDALGNVTHNTYDAAGNLLSTTDPLSRTTTYTYDANGNQLTVTDPRGHTTTYIYDALNRLIEVIEPSSCCGIGSRTMTYDAAGRVISETDALGFTTIYTYDVVGRKIAGRSPLGYTTVYTYDVADNLTARRERDGAVWQFAYDADGNQVRQIDPLGNVQETEYDLLNRVVRDTDPLGAMTEQAYDAAGQVVSVTDTRGFTTRYEYDLLGNQTRVVNPLGYTQVFTYDGAGNLIAERDERGYVTTYVYDALNRQIAQTDPLGHSRYTLYDAAGQVIADVDYNGQATTYAYDENGNQVRVTDALSHTETTVYDSQNHPIAVTDALSHTRRTGYDLLGRVISETTALGYTTVYTYDAEGRRIATTDPMGYTRWTEYDAAGHPVSEIDPLGRVTRTTYDALGRVIARTDPLSRTTSYEYDPLGRLLAVIGPEGTTQRYTYDTEGNILTEQDGNRHVTRYEYNPLGRLVRKTDPLGHIWHYTYDESGNQIAITTPAGHAISMEYDPLGRLVSKRDGASDAITYQYDANGNRTATTDTLGVSIYAYDARNRLVTSIDADGRMVRYAYDAIGQRISLTYPDGSAASYTYDADGRLQSVTAPDGGVTTYQYDALGRQTRVVQANGAMVETAYDAVGNVLSIVQKDAGGDVFARITYTVDDGDRRVRKKENLPQGIVVTNYTYDELDRLVSSVSDDGRENHYAFDGAGNRTAMWGIRARAGITETYRVDYAYNAANQLLRAVDGTTGITWYTYDADGNRTGSSAPDQQSTYAYDAEGHLVKARVQEEQGGNLSYKDGVYEIYTYDGDGRRVHKETYAVALGSVISRREYRYDDTTRWDVLQTYDVAATVTESRYLYDQSLHKLAYWQGSESGYLLNDGLGSVLGAMDGSGAAPDALMRYDDYGAELGPEDALPTDDGFTGYEHDAYTGLDYARNRYYDPATGTFLTADPFPADRQDVLSLHRYLYVQANPVDYSDPFGLFRWTSSMSGIVERGDTLWQIAAAYWGVPVRQVGWGMIAAIQRVNPWIRDPNLIYAGHRLDLPKRLSAYGEFSFNNYRNSISGTYGSNCGKRRVPAHQWVHRHTSRQSHWHGTRRYYHHHHRYGRHRHSVSPRTRSNICRVLPRIPDFSFSLHISFPPPSPGFVEVGAEFDRDEGALSAYAKGGIEWDLLDRIPGLRRLDRKISRLTGFHIELEAQAYLKGAIHLNLCGCRRLRKVSICGGVQVEGGISYRRFRAATRRGFRRRRIGVHASGDGRVCLNFCNGEITASVRGEVSASLNIGTRWLNHTLSASAQIGPKTLTLYRSHRLALLGKYCG